MALDATEQKDVAREWVRREYREAGKTAGLTAADIMAAASSLHTTIVNNQAALIASLPEPFASGSTVAQKRILFAAVAMKIAGLV